MKKIRLIAWLLTLVLIAGCGAQDQSSSRDDEDEDTYYSEEEDSELTGEEDYVADAITQEQATEMIYEFAVMQIGDIEERRIGLTYEGTITLEENEEECYSFRVSEETDEQSLTLGFYAIGMVSRTVFEMDPVTGEYVEIEPYESYDFVDGAAVDDSESNSGPSLEELVAAVQQSKIITFELAHDTSTQMPLAEDEMSYFMSGFTAQEIMPDDTGYPFRFLPEYRINCDTGVSFLIMKDDSISDYKTAFLMFEGSDVLYTCSASIIYDTFVRFLSPSTEDNMAYMHDFANGDDIASSIDAAVKSYGIFSAALEDAERNGYALASMMEEDIFRVDDYTVTELSEVDPSLVSVLIKYSVKTAYEDKPDAWIRFEFVGALWVEQRGATRTYVLGVNPYNETDSVLSQSDIAIAIYEKSFACVMLEAERFMD